MWKILLSSEENIDFFFLNKSYSLCWQWGSHIVIRDSYGKRQKVLKNCSGFFVLPLFVVTCLNNLVLAETQPSGHLSLPSYPSAWRKSVLRRTGLAGAGRASAPGVGPSLCFPSVMPAGVAVLSCDQLWQWVASVPTLLFRCCTVKQNAT